MAVGSRSRSVVLDPIKVRRLANNNGMKTRTAFESAFLRHIGAAPGVNNTTPSKAWNNKKLDKNRANELAIFLGLPNYDSLLPTPCPEIVFPEALTWDARYSPPGALLKAEYSIVPFHNREKELAELDAWCFQEDELAVRLYTGVGGMGKTRLAIEQCRHLANKHHWTTGFLQGNKYSFRDEEPFACLQTMTQAVFIVVDYAETRRSELVELLRMALKAKTKVRIVLLARAAADWWRILKTERYGVGDLLMSQATSRISLQSLSLTKQEREDSFFAAAKSFAKYLRHQARIKIPPDLGADYYERVLLLHMQALITVGDRCNAKGVNGQGIQGIKDILEVILNRERRFWETQANDRRLPKGLQKAIGKALAKLTQLGGAKNKKDAAQVLKDIPLLADSKVHERNVIMELLHDIYPSNQILVCNKTQDFKCNYIEPLQPDLLGEHLIQEELKNESDNLLSFIFD